MSDAVSGDDRACALCEDSGFRYEPDADDPQRAYPCECRMSAAEREAVARDARIRHLQAQARDTLNAAKDKPC